MYTPLCSETYVWEEGDRGRGREDQELGWVEEVGSSLQLYMTTSYFISFSTAVMSYYFFPGIFNSWDE